MSSTANGKPETVLITGGTDGLGRATAILFASEGYRVFAAARNAEKRAALEQLAEEKSLALETVELDVTSDSSADRAIAEVQRRAGPVDILVNNAGIAIVAAMEEISLDDLRKQFETNVFGAVRMAKRVLPLMRERRRGCIVNMSSVAGLVSNPLFGPYAGSKHALEGITDALRFELFPFGIRVVLIEPGYIPTNMERAATELSSVYSKSPESPYGGIYASFLEEWKRGASKSRYTPGDCAHVVLRAVRAARPKARYGVTRTATFVKLARRVLPDRMLDSMVIYAFRLDKLRDQLSNAALRRPTQTAVREQ